MNALLKTSLHGLRDNVLPMISLTRYGGREGSMLLAGEERWSRYLHRRFFAGETVKEPLGSFRTWQVPAALRKHRHSADITVARVDLLSRRFFPVGEYLRVPDWVRIVAPVPTSNAVFTSSSARSDMRYIAKQGLTWSVSHLPSDLEIHLARDYAPYTRLRHGGDAFVHSKSQIRKLFRQGGLLVVKKEGKPIAGLVFETRGTTLRMWTIACANGDPAHLNSRALAAIYSFSFEYARSLGLAFVDMRGCRPSTTDKLFFVKQKWGGVVRENPEIAFDYLVHWPKPNHAVVQFFSRSPLIFRDGRNLSLLAADPALHREKAQQVKLARVVGPEEWSGESRMT